MVQDHGAVFLSIYNVFGDAMLAALAPLLTGLKEWELPERMKETIFTMSPLLWRMLPIL